MIITFLISGASNCTHFWTVETSLFMNMNDTHLHVFNNYTNLKEKWEVFTKDLIYYCRLFAD